MRSSTILCTVSKPAHAGAGKHITAYRKSASAASLLHTSACHFADKNGCQGQHSQPSCHVQLQHQLHSRAMPGQHCARQCPMRLACPADGAVLLASSVKDSEAHNEMKMMQVGLGGENPPHPGSSESELGRKRTVQGTLGGQSTDASNHLAKPVQPVQDPKPLKGPHIDSTASVDTWHAAPAVVPGLITTAWQGCKQAASQLIRFATQSPSLCSYTFSHHPRGSKALPRLIKDCSPTHTALYGC